LASGLFLYVSPFFGQSPHEGWFVYVSFTSQPYSPALGMDCYALSLIFLTISATAGTINFIVTIFRLRSPGMAISNMPLFHYSTLTVSLTIVFALLALTASCVLLELDRRYGTHS